MIEHSFGRVDTRLSEMHAQLANIMGKINNISMTMAFSQRNSSPHSDSSDSFNTDDDNDTDDSLEQKYGGLKKRI